MNRIIYMILTIVSAGIIILSAADMVWVMNNVNGKRVPLATMMPDVAFAGVMALIGIGLGILALLAKADQR